MARRQFQDAFPEVIINRQSIDLPNVALTGVATVNVTVPGAMPGDMVLMQSDGSLGQLGYNARVSAADNVLVSLQNSSTSAVNPAAQFFTFVLLRPRQV